MLFYCICNFKKNLHRINSLSEHFPMRISYKFVYKFRHCHFPYMPAITKTHIVFVHKCPVVCLTAIYIRDTNTLKPVVSAASIRYDKITVNDKELTLKKLDSMDADGFKNLLKDNGQLDSNDPINGWDGCAVEEVSINSSTQCKFYRCR